MEPDHEFIRYQAVEPNHRGVKIGIFGLANGLAREGALTEQDYQWWTRANAWYDDAYPDPSTIDPSVYDRGVNPKAQAWFRLPPVICWPESTNISLFLIATGSTGKNATRATQA